VQGLRSFFLTRPLWQTIPFIVAISVAGSVCTLFLLSELMGIDRGSSFARSLTIAILAPILVSAPVGGYVVHLLREVERARHQALLQAWRDELTGLPNRRRFAELATRELALVTRGQRQLVLALMDVDDFKRVNDMHGHAAGDVVLRAVGQMLPGQLRGTDLVARWGGEEFVLLLPDTGTVDAAGLVERVRSAVEALQVMSGQGRPLRFTVSIGITEARPEDSFDTLIDRADQAMYRAKAAGKNRVVQAAA
jgi:diguanylate cyclase (GGDEF)-like protein